MKRLQAGGLEAVGTSPCSEVREALSPCVTLVVVVQASCFQNIHYIPTA